MTGWVLAYIFPKHLYSLLSLLIVICASRIKASQMDYRSVKSYVLQVKLLELTCTPTIFCGSGCSFTWNISNYQMLMSIEQGRNSWINKHLATSCKKFKALPYGGYCHTAPMTQSNTISCTCTRESWKSLHICTLWNPTLFYYVGVH